jgi:hypothetical protein
MVQSIFISLNFHVRKEYALHPPKPSPAYFDGVTTVLLTLVIFLSIFYLLRMLQQQPSATFTLLNMATMVLLTPLSKILPI